MTSPAVCSCCPSALWSVLLCCLSVCHLHTHTEILSSALAPEVGQVCSKLYNMLSHQNSKTASAHTQTHKHARTCTRSALQSKWEPGIQISEFQMQLDSPLCLSSYTPPPPTPSNPASQCLCVSMTTAWNYYIISKKGAAVEFCTHAHKPEQFFAPTSQNASPSPAVTQGCLFQEMWHHHLVGVGFGEHCQVKPYFKEA